MTRQEIIRKIADDAEITQKTAGAALNSFINILSGTLAEKDKISLIGFGTFSVAHRKAGKGRNPKTGEVLDIPARDVPVFKASKKLKEAVK